MWVHLGANAVEATSILGASSLMEGKSSSAICAAPRLQVSFRLISCSHSTLDGNSAPTVTGEYFSHLDMSQRRMDLDQRPELCLGSVDFVVGQEYWVQEDPSNPGVAPRAPQPMNYIFAIDVSWTSGKCGLVREVVAGLRELLYPDDSAGESSTASGALPTGSKVAIMTFDKTVQFYNLAVSFSSLALPARIWN